MSFEAGRIAGDYEVIGVLGAGGMGSVYKVRNRISDRVEAMKVLLPDLTSSPDLAERFLNEIKVLASFRHPNIAALHTALRVDNQLLMIMELVDGTNVEDRLRQGPIPIAEAVSIVSQALAALAYAHARGVVHRDIKPANIALDSDGTVKLLDFGIARAGAERHLTRTGMVLGSLYYMSPEQVNGQAADGRSDLYSVGLTLYKAVTGRRAIDGDSEFALMRAQVDEVPPAPHALDARIPRGLSDVILRALEKAPERRFQTAEEFRRALEPFLSVAETATIAEPSRRRPESPSGTGPTPIPSSSTFHAAALNALQGQLAKWVGPIAGTLVRRQMPTAATLAELCRGLAQHIPLDADRRAFLKGCVQELGPEAAGDVADSGPRATAATELAPAQPPNWDAALIVRLKKQMAQFIGPVAGIMVDRAAKKARSFEELYTALAGELATPKDREQFLAGAARDVNDFTRKGAG